MKNKEKIKIVITAIGVVIVLFLIVGMAMYLKVDNNEPDQAPTKQSNKIHGDFITSTFGRYIKYYEVDNSAESIAQQYSRKILTTYDDYRVFIDNTKFESKLVAEDFIENSYIILFAENGYCDGTINKINNLKSQSIGESSNIMIGIGYNESCEKCPTKYTLFLIPMNKNKLGVNSVILDSYEKESFPKC